MIIRSLNKIRYNINGIIILDVAVPKSIKPVIKKSMWKFNKIKLSIIVKTSFIIHLRQPKNIHKNNTNTKECQKYKRIKIASQNHIWTSKVIHNYWEGRTLSIIQLTVV